MKNCIQEFNKFKSKDPLYQAIDKLDKMFEGRIGCIDYMNQLMRLEHFARQGLLSN